MVHSPATQSPSRPRRTQQERKEATRRRLLDSTLECLVEQGYAQTTTQAVAQRAGLSQGAIFKHFATKAELLAAAAEHLFPRLIAEYREKLTHLPQGEERVARSIQLLWSLYHRPELLAVLELYMAARTDRELASALGSVDPPHRRSLHRAARQLFPEAAASHPEFDAFIELVLSAVQGATVGGVALPPNPDHRHMLELLTHFARPMLSGGPPWPKHSPPISPPSRSPRSL
jgi:AcrR family transcriptional regulator